MINYQHNRQASHRNLQQSRSTSPNRAVVTNPTTTNVVRVEPVVVRKSYTPAQQTYTPAQQTYTPAQQTYTPAQQTYAPTQQINTHTTTYNPDQQHSVTRVVSHAPQRGVGGSGASILQQGLLKN